VEACRAPGTRWATGVGVGTWRLRASGWAGGIEGELRGVNCGRAGGADGSMERMREPKD
jgi:hypothetical protein